MSSTIRILIIDDEPLIRSTLILHLKSDSYDIAEAETGALGLKLAGDFHPHLIILDLGLPDISGYDCLLGLRKWTQVPIIILTVDDNEVMKVRLLDAGADDYLTKPFGGNELLARIRVSLRHHNHIEATPVFKSQNLEINLNLRKVFVLSEEIKLTNTEFEVLACLVREAGQVVSQKILLKKIWGISGEGQNHYLRIYIKELRKKIEIIPSSPKHIITEPGVGYRIL